MFGLLIVVAIYAILGFMLAWIVGIVAKEEISVGQGVIVLILTAVASIAAEFAIGGLQLGELVEGAFLIAVNFGALTLFTKLIAEIEWKPSLIVAAIYTAILTAISLLLL